MKNKLFFIITSFILLAGIIVSVIEYFLAKKQEGLNAVGTGSTPINPNSLILAYLAENNEQKTNELKEVNNRLSELEYIPIEISSFTNNINTVEKGTIITEITFNFLFNKIPTSASINNNIGGISGSSITKTVLLTSNTTFVLTASDGRTTVTKNTSLALVNRVYWGTSENSVLTNSQVLALSNSVLSTSKTRNYSIAGEGKRLVYAVPSSYGNVSFKLGGFSFTALTKTTQNITNALGNTTSYDIYVTDTVQYGTNIQVEAI